MLNNVVGAGYDYCDSFAAEPAIGDDRSPEQWARATFEQAPRAVRWFLRAGFRFVLGLRLGPRRSPRHVFGWTIVEEGPDSITLELRSWCLTSRLLFRTHDSLLTQSTFVRYDRPVAAVIWAPVGIVHRQIIPRLLRRATSHEDTQRTADQPSTAPQRTSAA